MEDKEVDTLLHRMLDLLDLIIKQKDSDLQKLALEYADLNYKYIQLKDVNSVMPQMYTLEMISVAYNLIRESHKKIYIIKAIREKFGISLKVAKDLVDAISPPYIHEG